MIEKLIGQQVREEPVCTGPRPKVDYVQMGKLHTVSTLVKCKWCKSLDTMKYGIRRGVQLYICRTCRRTFSLRDTPARMRFTVEQIGSAVSMFYGGMSLSTIARHMQETYREHINPSSVYRWVLRYTKEAVDYFEPLPIKVGNVWVVDETVIKVAGKNRWFWDIIDDQTRFLLASHHSGSRMKRDVIALMASAYEKAGKAPQWILSDGLASYPDGIEQVFGAESRHVRSGPFAPDMTTNLIERFHGTLKARTKVMRGFKTKPTSELILAGFLVNYNYFRPHMSLRGKTPAESAGLSTPFTTWTDIVRKS